LIKDNSKQFSILIDDNTREQKYKLGPGYSEQRVVAVVKTLVTDFASAVYFVLDNKSEFYKSSNREVISRELSKRNIKLLTFSDFVNLDNDEKLFNNFNREIENIAGNEGAIFLLDEETYQSIAPEIIKCKKKGYRVVNSSLLLQTIK
jgi:sugar-specific transcriptional regulator TrmB